MFKDLRYYNLFLTIVVFFFAVVSMSLAQQRGKFNQTVNANGWSGNVEFFAANSNSPQALIIGLHPYQSPAWGIRDMLQQSAENYQAIVACPDGDDNTLGDAVLPLIQWCKEKYNIDETKIILTGYSAGGQTTFIVGPQNYQLFRGIIGIASANSYYLTQQAVDNLGIGIICGTADASHYSTCQSVSQMIENMGGNVKFISVDGVDHTGPYYFSSEFTDDWDECYDFIMSIVPKPAQIILQSPENRSEDLDIPITFTWNADANSDSYEMELSDDDGIIDVKTPTQNSITLNKSLEKGINYFWRVRGVNSSSEGPWSNRWSFSTKPLAPTAAVTLIEPVNNAENIKTTFVFKWQSVEGATAYNFQLLDENDEIVQDKKGIESSDTLVRTVIGDLQSKTIYKWKVQGINSGGEGPWSEIWQFTTAPASPTDVVEDIFPENNAKDIPTILTLSWNKVDKATKYHLQLLEYGSENFVVNDSNITAIDDNDTITYTTEELSGKQMYKWRVSGLNDGGEGPWSNYRIFTTWDPTDVIDINDISNINVKPNPANYLSIINITLNNNAKTQIDIIDISGRIIRNAINKFMEKGNYSLKLNLVDIESGYYFLKLQSGNSIKVVPLIVIH